MSDNIPVRNGQVVDCLTESIVEGKAGLEHVPALLVRVIDEEMWKERFVKCIKQIVRFDSFTAFVNAKPPEGLGCEVELIKNMCINTPAYDAIDRVLQRKPGRPTTLDNVQDSTAPTGNTKAAALRRLRKDRPDLHAKVITGETTANAAMISAGFRKKPTSDEQAVKAIRKAENRLAVAKVLIDLCEPCERLVIKEWIESAGEGDGQLSG